MKDLIIDLNKSCTVYKFNWFCKRCYTEQTSNHFKTRIEEHLPACVLKLIEEEHEIKTTTTKNATKLSSSAEHLINNRYCANKLEMLSFKISNQFVSIFYLVKLDAISIFWNKLESGKQ